MATIINNNSNSLPILISQQQQSSISNNNNNNNYNNHPSSLPSSVSPQKRSPVLTSLNIPPPPPSSSLKFPLELSDKSQVCNLKINLDKSYFTNGETISGKINIFLTERQCIKRIKLQLCGYEKIFQHEQYSNNTYQTFKFYSGNLNIPPTNINIETTSQNSLTDSINSPINSFYSSSNNNNNNNNINNNNLPLSEFEIGSYEYPFQFSLPKYLAPSLNYIGYLSIFYFVHCKIEYSKGKDWKDQKVMKSSELWISGINKQYQDYLKLNKTIFTTHKIAQYIGGGPTSIINRYDKSKPIEMAVCLLENNVYIGDKVTLFIKIKNPYGSPNKLLSTIRVELFQQISFVKSLTNNNDRRIKAKIQKLNRRRNNEGGQHYDYSGGGGGSSENITDLESKNKVSQTQILLHNYNCKQLKSNEDDILSTSIQISIPHKIEDDQVFPSTRGFLSTVKHFFIISIPSISDFKIKVPIQLWQRYDDYNFITTSNSGNSSNIPSPISNSNSSNSLHSSGSVGNMIYNEFDDSDEEEGENRVNLIPPKEWRVLWLPKWKDESTVTNCDLCDCEFTIIKRMHHCRSCGGVFCEACSNQKVPLFGYGITKKVRICLMCFDAVKTEVSGITTMPSSSSYSNNLNNATSIVYGINSLNLNGVPPQAVFSKKKVYKPPFLVHL